MDKLAALGHACTGVDISKNSISYAINQAKEKGLEIKYICQNYLDLDFENQFDLIILIYTDLLNDINVEQKFQEQQTWTFENSGFWKPTPYMELANGFHYPDEKVFLYQHTIIDESDRVYTYRFWTHYFNPEDVRAWLSTRRFIRTECFENILPASDVWNGENVTFFKTQK